MLQTVYEAACAQSAKHTKQEEKTEEDSSPTRYRISASLGFIEKVRQQTELYNRIY